MKYESGRKRAPVVTQARDGYPALAELVLCRSKGRVEILKTFDEPGSRRCILQNADASRRTKATREVSDVNDPFIHLRLLAESDLSKPLVATGVESMDRMTWSDRYYEAATSDQQRRTYVLDLGSTIVGYLTVHQTDGRCFTIDEVAVSKTQQGVGLGGTLLRFADILARQGDSRILRLRAIKKQIGFYRHFGYRHLESQPIRIGHEEYHLMEKTILYYPSRRLRLA